MALINCPKCNETISSRAAVCPYCGFSLDEMRTCPECGSLILEKADACPECGYPLEDEDANIRGTVSDTPLPLDTAVSESGSADLSQSASESIGAPADKNSASTTARPGVIKRMLSKIDNTVSIIGGIILICILLGAMGLRVF